MIEKLEQLSIGQFIDLLCGDTSILTSKREIVSEAKVTNAIRNIVFEYKEIADIAGVRNYLSLMDEMIKAKISSTLFSMCNNLVALGEHDRAREVMIVYGINAKTMNDQRVAAEIKSRLERAKSTIARIEEESNSDKKEDSDIRRMFDEQTASMMAYFKFQIDTTTMKASVYAHLVARHNWEIKAQLAAMNKK